MNINLIGLITGIVFGMIMQRSRVIRYDKQINVLLFKDMTVMKFMMSAIIVGMVGIYMLKDLELIKLSVKPAILGAVIVGGLVFGAGWGLVGYCPATAMAALGEGRVDAGWGIGGMILGAGIFSHLYPMLKKTILTWGDLGKITIPQMLNAGHWSVIPLLILTMIVLLVLIDRR